MSAKSKFESWMVLVDRALAALTGGEINSHLDFEDWDYASAYEDYDSPKQAARRALVEAGY